ncbi:MAG TPA: DUF5658 family protein [Vicinamibacterales bacterium]|nr:DUF5658 family protein [Vicinamibacterales bacterium]
MRIARAILAIFIALQLADGLITFAAVQIFGPAAEGNPILVAWIHLAGPAATLFVAKGVSCGLAVLLYSSGRFKTLGALTAIMLFCAIGPWLSVLTAMP